jgi:Fic family protein
MPENNAAHDAESSDEKYRFPTVRFDSELVTRAFELERLRADFGSGSTPPALLAQLHVLFQIVMSVVSARIEGNRTTIYEAVGADLHRSASDDSRREIQNLLAGMSFIDDMDAGRPLSHVFVRELHRIAVDGLEREGDTTPGSYRTGNVRISKSAHVPPAHVYVQPEMTGLLDFANRSVPTSQQMIHVAMAHHRFLWIHPFGNGNGRVSRLLSYAMLRRHGFESRVGFRTVNPMAVFGNDRDGYYSSLAAADDLSNAGTIEWCSFFVRGIQEDMERLARLQDFEFVVGRLMAPALERLVASGAATLTESRALAVAIGMDVVKAGDLAEVINGTPSQRSVAIHAMLDKGLLRQDARGPRFYRAAVSEPPLAAYVIRQLDAIGYLPRMLRDDD